MESKPLTDEFDQKRQQLEENLQAMLPPINTNAKKIEDVFTLNQLIDQSLLDRLNEEALALLKTAPEHMP